GALQHNLAPHLAAPQRRPRSGYLVLDEGRVCVWVEGVSADANVDNGLSLCGVRRKTLPGRPSSSGRGTCALWSIRSTSKPPLSTSSVRWRGSEATTWSSRATSAAA